MALPKKNRIKKQSEFAEVLRAGKRFRGVFLSIVFIRKTTKGVNVAVVVPSKIIPKATARNRLKRMILEEVYRFIKEKKSLSLIVYLNKNTAKEDIKKEIRFLFNKIDLD